MSLSGLDRRRAFRWALLATLSPPLLSYSFLFFTEPIAALIVLICVRRFRESSWSGPRGLLTGVLVGLLTFIHIRNALAPIDILAVPGVVLLWQAPRNWPSGGARSPRRMPWPSSCRS
jgi:hypothetical protein